MAKSKRKVPAVRLYGGPLQEAVRNAKSDVMREIAQIAVAKGVSQEDLARATFVTTPALKKHFARENPHPQTVERYARALKISEAHLKLVSGGSLTSAEQREAQERLAWCLERARPAFKDGTLQALKQHIASLDVASQRRLLEAFALKDFQARTAGHAISFNAGWPPKVPWPLQEFARELLPAFDLKKHLRPVTEPADFLSGLWLFAAQVMSLESSDKLVGYVTSLLESESIDHKHMDEYLKTRRAEFLANPKAYRIKSNPKSEEKKS